MSIQLKLEQHGSPPGKAALDAREHWIALLPAARFEQACNTLPYGDFILRVCRRGDKPQPDRSPVVLNLPNGIASQISIAGAGAKTTAFNLLTLARRMVADPLRAGPSEVGIVVAGFHGAEATRMAEALLAALLAASAEMPRYKRSQKERQALKLVHLYGIEAKDGFKRTFAEAEGNNLARCLTGLPPNALTPHLYRKRVAVLAKENRWRMEFLDCRALARKKAGAFLAVAQGSPEPDAGIIHLQYHPTRKRERDGVTLVGKGICFDTGGVNLKPANFMLGMHKDMQGSAVALGTLLALTRLQVPFPAHCWMALATNHIGPRAYKPNDVVTASDGTTIEVINTDAEGRMVLADTLALASADKPLLMIDFATLTGACKRALGNAYSGVFTNRPEHLPVLIAAGSDSGERVWPFPIDEDYDEFLESTVADTKQCHEEG
ncbi:MAG: leucyl aminopeptidase family protein, partial [Verrucomicrobiales bacterium]|nr:leucyl aminopeptidase family protein [Verrucomicrobiales bacterium]